MKKILISLIAALVIPCAFAADNTAKKMTIAQEVGLFNALTALDGHTVIPPKVGGQDQSPINVAYDFTGEVRWKIRDNLMLLKPKFEAWQKITQDILKKVSNGTNFVAASDSKRQAEYNQAIFAQGEIIDEHAPKLYTLTREDLNINVNPIAGTLILALGPILPIAAPPP